MQHTMAYIRRCRTRQAQELESFGWHANGLAPKQLDTIEKKLAGDALNSFQFWEVFNVHKMKLVKGIVERRLGKPNFSTEKMRVYTREYDEFVQQCFDDWNLTQENLLFGFLALFTLEWKYSFEFYYKIIQAMISCKINELPDLKKRILLFSGPKCFILI